MIITTTQDLAAVGDCDCPCEPVTCAEPQKECQSKSATISAEGHKNTEDEAWTRYKVHFTETSWSDSNNTDLSDESVSAYEKTGSQFSALFSGYVGDGGEGCTQFEVTETPICLSTGSYSYSSYENAGGTPPTRGDQLMTISRSRSDVSGTESDAHKDWVIAHPDFEAEMEAWQAAHDAWAIEHAAWAATKATHDAWEACEAATPGACGDEPPAPGDEPAEPPQPDAEPETNYPPCTFRDDTTTTDYSVDPPDVTTSYEVGGALTTVYYVWGEPASYSFTTTYEDAQDYDAWIAATTAEINTAITFDPEECLDEDGACGSKVTVTPDTAPESTNTNVYMQVIKARYRFGVPAGYSTTEAPRSVYELQWDEMFFPKAWTDWKALSVAYTAAVAAHEAWEACEAATPGDCGEEPVIPSDPGEAPTPGPSLVAERTWAWAGSMEEPWSEWFEIDLPTAAGETRLVNLMAVCHHSTRLGVKPTAYGEVYVIPPP